MKYLLLLVIVVAVLWLMRMGRTGETDAKSARDAARGAAPRQRAAPPQEIVACAHCGVHLPRSEALPGPAGRLYCSESHRQLREGQA